MSRRKKSDNNDKILILRQVFKFIGPEDTDPTDLILKKFLLLDKTSSKLIMRQVLKQALIYERNQDKLVRKRVGIWKRILGVDQDTKDYFAFRDKVNSKTN